MSLIFFHWRDLRRRQRLRYVLLLTIGIVLLGGMGLLVSRTARLQRDFLATLHTTADAQLLASLKQREQAMREAWQQHQRQRQQYQRRSAIAAATRAAGAGGRSARAGVADAAGVPGRTPHAGRHGP